MATAVQAVWLMPSDIKAATLAEAHEALLRCRPSYDAEPQVWAAFHRRSAEVYTNIAKVDVRHRHEAGYWATAEMRRARDLEDNPPPRREYRTT